MYAALLFRARKKINPSTASELEDRANNPDIAHLQFLFASYSPECMYFEVHLHAILRACAKDA